MLKVLTRIVGVLAVTTVLSAKPLVVGHRGASGILPEHTLEAYQLALRQGADYIEPDLVPTKDGVLVARHENDISDTTDVSKHPEFADRKVTKTIDGRRVTGWFTEDFTWEELQTLRARGRNRTSRNNERGQKLVNLTQILDAVKRWEKEFGRPIGIYPETKHPSYFRKLGLPIEEPLLDALDRYGYQGADAPVIIQSFEVSNLKKLRNLTKVKLSQLVDDSGAPQDWVEAGDSHTYADMLTPQGLQQVATYADIIAPYKGLVIERDANGEFGRDTGLVQRAHSAGLLVHCWTFRAENNQLWPSLRKGKDPEGDGDLATEVARFFGLGVDGVFSNHPGPAAQARDAATTR